MTKHFLMRMCSCYCFLLDSSFIVKLLLKNFCRGFLYLFLSGIIEFDQRVIIDLNYTLRENLNRDSEGASLAQLGVCLYCCVVYHSYFNPLKLNFTP